MKQSRHHIAWIAKKYDLIEDFSINLMWHLIVIFINDAGYKDNQKRAVTTTKGTSINMLHKHYTDSKKETFNVAVQEDKQNKKEWVKKKYKK